MKFLIIDDESIAIRVLTVALTSKGVIVDDDILAATTEEEALEILYSKKIDVVFLDLSLSERHDGLRLLEYIKTRTPYVKICIVSADVHIETVKKCLSMGADIYIKKPFSTKQIQRLIFKIRK